MVCVLDGRLDEFGSVSAEYTYSCKKAEDWCADLRKQCPQWRVELSSVDRALQRDVQIVVNPFGEVYPEEDLSLHSTFARIRDYVRRGGVFVNVAGYPFFYKWNPTTKMRVEAGRWERASADGGGQRMELKPLLPDLLGIIPLVNQPTLVNTRQDSADRQRFGEIAGAGGTPAAKVFRH